MMNELAYETIRDKFEDLGFFNSNLISKKENKWVTHLFFENSHFVVKEFDFVVKEFDVPINLSDSRKLFSNEVRFLKENYFSENQYIWSYESEEIGLIAVKYFPGVHPQDFMRAGFSDVDVLINHLIDKFVELQNNMILYGSISPSNIIVNENAVRFINYSRSSLFNQSDNFYSFFKSIFSSPELSLGYLNGKNIVPNIQSEIYAFGSMILYLLSRQCATKFTEDTIQKLSSVDKIVQIGNNGASNYFQVLRKDLSPKHRKIFDGCLEKNPSNRFSSFADIPRL